MLVTKNKAKNGKTYINIIINKDYLKLCKNKDFFKVSLLEDYKVGLSNKATIEIGKLDISKLITE